MAGHLPVLRGEVVQVLRPERGGVYVDATVGLGGHAEAILERLGEGTLVCMDRDGEALGMAVQRLHDRRCVFVHSRFSDMDRVLAELKIGKVDGVLMDLGVSMYQLAAPERGFSFRSEERLDMRMDAGAAGPTAWEIVNEWPEAEIARVIWEYGEERHSRRIARAIVRARQKGHINTCSELSSIIGRALPGRGRTNPATRTFQALRITVNDEMGELKRGLGHALSSLASGGRLAVISYHSLEDREVKNIFRNAEREGGYRVLTKKPVRPGRDELLENPSARSARLRAAEAI